MTLPSGPIITLTTDFGETSPYVAAMKGVILSVNPRAALVDLGHQIPPQDIRYAAFFLAGCLPYFPPGTIHVIVIDPGVGTDRPLLHVEAGERHLLVPDNGCWTLAVEKLRAAPTVRRLTEPRFWCFPVSSTFHGRDILSPTAAHLSLGIPARELGPAVQQWERFTFPSPVLQSRRLEGEVIFIDHFGNLLTNIPGDAYLALANQPVRIRAAGQEVSHRVQTYAQAPVGSPLALVSSSGLLEVAVNCGNAARLLQIDLGARVIVEVSTAAKT